jgi:hypothetical protein
MPDDPVIRYRPETREVVERDYQNAQGGGSSGNGGGGSSGGGSTSNETREDPRYTGPGDSYSNQQRGQATKPQPPLRFQDMSSESQPPKQSQGEQPKEQNTMHYPCPPLAYGAVAPYGVPYAAPYGVPPVAPAGANVVVSGHGDHNDGIHSQLETLSDVALGGLRESAATGRTNQLSTQIAQLGERHSMEAGFSRELSTQREFTAAQKDRGDLENRLLTAIKDESIRTREMFTENRIRSLESENTNLRESRRFQELDNDLSEIKRMLRERANA